VLVTKPALGRSLGNLLEGSRKNASPEGNVASGPDQLDLTSVTPGLGSLLRGNGTPARDELPLDVAPPEVTPNLFGSNVAPSGDNSGKPQSLPEVIPTPSQVPIGLVQLSLFAADVLLLALSWMLVRAGTLSGFWMVLFCFVTVSLGAWLACLAVFLEPEQPEKLDGNSGRPLNKQAAGRKV
jgi:hypothetical protein